jgi:hypothetical protein
VAGVSEALGRTIRYRDVLVSGWSEKLLEAGVPAHTVKHLCVMTELTKQGRYDRMTEDLLSSRARSRSACTTLSNCMPLNSRARDSRPERPFCAVV